MRDTAHRRSIVEQQHLNNLQHAKSKDKCRGSYLVYTAVDASNVECLLTAAIRVAGRSRRLIL
jgi:hypothetical protein